MTTKMRNPRYVYQCDGCQQYHPLKFDGDCRDDAHRYPDPPEGSILLDEYAPEPPAGIRTRPGVEVGCGEWACALCYEGVG